MSKIFTVTLPDIGEGVVEGEVIEWLKEVGETLEQDEPVVVVMTDKATVDLPAPHPGILVKQYFSPGEMALLDKPLYDIELAEEVPSKSTPQPQEEFSIEVPEPAASPKPVSGKKALATPSTRRMAKEMGIDIGKVHGTGPDGRVTPQDLGRVSTPEPLAINRLPQDEVQTIRGIRGLMAKNTAQSKRTIPHFSYFESVDVTGLMQQRNKVREDFAAKGLGVTYMPFFLRALSLTISQHSIVNSSVDTAANELIIHHQHNLGVAVNAPKGLIVPVLKNVQEMSLHDIIRAFEVLKEKALAGKLQSSDMKGATITLSNYGALGNGLWATPVINHPQVAILAINKIRQQPVVENGQVVIRDMLNLSWSFDHRIIDGDIAAQVSHYFATLLREPDSLLCTAGK